MKIIWTINIAFIIARGATAQPSIDLVYPPEGHRLPAVAASFIYGSVTPGSVLSANGRRVEVEPNGAFMAYIPFDEGDFTIKLEAANEKGKSVLERKVTVARARTLIPTAGPRILSGSISPNRPLSLGPGERLYVSFRGTPGLKASFRVGSGHGQMMTEQTSAVERDEKLEAFGEGDSLGPLTLPGTYVGSISFPGDGSWSQERIYCCLIDSWGNEYLDSTGPIISSWPHQEQTVALITDSFAVFKTWPDLGYEIFPPPGIKVIVNGQEGDYYRVRLSSDKEVWVKKNSLKILDPGQALAPAKAALARVDQKELRTEVRITLSRPVIFRIEPGGDCRRLTLWLYGARADMDWIRQPEAGYVKNICWSQPQSEVVTVEIELQKPFWGYRAEYRNNVLVLTIRPWPRIDSRRPFHNLRIAVDPGHSPDNGAVGPLRTLEKDVNWQTAQKLAQKLKALGADVYYTREGAEAVGLYQRPVRAVQWQADILVSLHHNASPDGANPLKNSGFSTYYYHPHSRSLAAAVHQEFRRRLKLPDHGFFYGNLVLCREPYLPSFLVEPAFIIVPKQEALIRSESFQNRVVEAIIAGMRRFLTAEKIEPLQETESLLQAAESP